MHALLRLAYSAAGAVATGASSIAPRSEGKLLRSFSARRDLIDRYAAWARTSRDAGKPLLWMHGPSVGEGLQARPVLELVRARHPDVQLAYTFFSPSAERFARALDVDFADYLPFDTTRGMRRVVELLRPTALVFSKLDLWPLLCHEASAAGVRLGLVSGTVAGDSSRRGGVAYALLHGAYATLDAAGAISTDDATRLVSLGTRPGVTRVTGDSRYDQVWARARAADRSAAGALLAALSSPRPTLVAGSTWPADERVLLAGWLAVRARVPGARLIIAPHEPTVAHLEPIERWAATNALPLERLDAPAAAQADVVLIDRVGVLGDLYALAQAAFVGGGFHHAGLHSVLEPAAFGAPVVFGPHFTNSRDAALLLDADGGACVHDVRQTADTIIRWLGSADGARIAGEHARGVVERGLGAAERSYELVAALIS